MKKYYALFAMMILFTGVMWGQTTVNLDTPSNWIQDGAIAFTSYGNHSYSESGLTIAGTNVLRNSTTAQDGFAGALGTYSMRIGNTASSKVVTTVASGGVSSFSIKVRRWDNSPMPNYTVKYSIDGGSNWTSLTNIDGTLLTTSDWFTYSNNINNANDNIKIEIANTGTTERIMIDDFSWTGFSGSSPLISLSTSSLSNFGYIFGSGPSTSQNYNLSGSDLDPNSGNITVTGSDNYEVSTDDANFSSIVNVAYSDGALSETPVYVRLKSGLSAGSYNDETIANAGGGATTQNVTASGTVYKVEPTNHAESFASAAGTPDHTSIDITWTDATGGTVPDGYLIKASTTSYVAIVDPVDGTAESNGTLVKNVLAGVQTATFSSLSPSTTYYFKIYPYTNSSTNINYKTDGTVPTTSLATDAPPPASLLLEENFDYTADALLTNNGWTAHSGGGTEAITVNNGGLTFTDYASVSGNSALVDNNGEDINKTFSEVSSGVVYVSFLVKVDAIAAGYFFNLGPASIGTTFRGKVFIQDISGNLQFGLSKGSNTGSFSTNNYSTGTTYLLVLKYEIVDGASNDEVSLFVFEDLDDFSTEPETPTIGPLTDAGQTDINPGSAALRQYSASQNILVDGIRISEEWTLAPLPVELTSFTATAKSRGVELAWSTATEVNNYGFEVERCNTPLTPLKGGNQATWSKIGFVEGNGTTNAPKSYTFVDGSASGTVVYRLKQIDRDGSFEYSNQVEVTVATPKVFALMQNHPNPFNPATSINYTLPVSGHVSLKIYDMLGKEVATLVNGVQDAGVKIAQFNASQLPSGIYFYTLRTNTFSATKKMLLVK